jgi:DNA-binding IclR family transcriptional regulator
VTEAKRVYRIQSLERAVRILDVIAASPRPMHLRNIAAAAGLHKVTVYRYLCAMEALDLVEADDSGRWWMGAKIALWGRLSS